MSLLRLLKSYSLYLIVRLNTVCIIRMYNNTFVHTVKKLLFKYDCVTKYNLHNPVNFFAILLIILFIGIVTRASFYKYQTSSH